MSLPVTRPAGRALVVGHPVSRRQPLEMLRQMGFTCAEADDPYAAMGELCRCPSEYKAVILSLAGVYTEELELIAAIKQRHPAVEVWLTDAEGRQTALAEAVRLGADGVADEDGFHRVAMAPPPTEGRTRGATAAAVLAAELSQLAGASPMADTGEHPRDECDSAGAIGNGARPEETPAPSQVVGPAHATDGGAASSGAERHTEETADGDPVLTADELRALLHEPTAPTTQASHSEP